MQNTGTIPASYRIEAVYDNTFTSASLLPFNTYGIGQRNYDLSVVSVSNPIQLNAGGQQVVRINYLTPDGGQLPSGVITYTLTATTSEGNYLADTEFGQFGTTLIDTNGQSVDHSQMPQVLLDNTPLISTLVQFGSSAVCSLAINVQNPIDDPVIVDLQQILPAGSTIIDPGAGTLSTNQLLWEVDLQPGESRLIQVTLNLPSPLGQPPLSNTVATVYDQVDATWLQFQAAPTLIQVTQSPQAQLQTLGFTSQGLGLALQTFAPGVYRVEATKDFKAWTPVVTCTNVQGLINVQDPAALTNAFRFYRAVQIQ